MFLLLNIFIISASIKTTKNIYNTQEIVYATSAVGAGDNLCRSQNPPSTVTLYVVENKDSWKDGDDFEEITSSEVSNSRFSNVKIWENPKSGNYDLIIDCNNNKKYDETIEPLFKQGFSVIAKEGVGIIQEGGRKIPDFSWNYDPEEIDSDNEILQIRTSAKNEDIKLNNVELNLEFPQNSTLNLEIYSDKNNNGFLNPVDVSIGKIEVRNKTETIPLDYTLSSGVNESLLFVYKMNENYQKGDYKIRIASLTGLGVSSDKPIKFLGVPISSNKMIVSDKKSCLGSLDLILTPNPAAKNSVVMAKISNLTGCDGKTVFIKNNVCSLPIKEISSCTM